VDTGSAKPTAAGTRKSKLSGKRLQDFKRFLDSADNKACKDKLGKEYENIMADISGEAGK